MEDSSKGMTEEEARVVFLHPSGNTRFLCPTDNDGYPTCMGDGSMCGFSRVLQDAVCTWVRDT